MILHLLDGNGPALHRVALGAIGPHFPLVDVFVAVLAVFPNIGENWLYVALRALHLFVHSPQRILGLVVIELRNRADRPPTRCVMTVFARDRQRPVRTSGIALLICGQRSS